MSSPIKQMHLSVDPLQFSCYFHTGSYKADVNRCSVVSLQESLPVFLHHFHDMVIQ